MKEWIWTDFLALVFFFFFGQGEFEDGSRGPCFDFLSFGRRPWDVCEPEISGGDMRLPSRMDWLGYWANPLDYCHTGVCIEQYSPSLKKRKKFWHWIKNSRALRHKSQFPVWESKIHDKTTAKERPWFWDARSQTWSGAQALLNV